MKILVVGSGGREHAIAWKLKQSDRISKVFVAPGNAGTNLEEGLENIPITEIDLLVQFAKKEKVAFTVIGPEAPLSEGIVDVFQENGLRAFGPGRKPAQLESSKEFAKQFMLDNDIPTAKYRAFTDAPQAHEYIKSQGAPIVVKADGLAAGKGVVVALTEEDAHEAIDMMLVENGMGSAGAKVVIEEFLHGEEASFIVMLDGDHILPLATSQDHKRLLDADKGPNTGGMGAYSPAPIVTPDIHAKVMQTVIEPVVRGMKKNYTPFTGFLYAGLMIGADSTIKVLEFNCRLGDPETQPIMLRLKSDLATLIEHALSGSLNKVDSEWDRRTALGIVLASEGYPHSPRKGDAITFPEELPDNTFIFHAGTNTIDGNIVTSGGRVLCITSLGETVREARDCALETADKVTFDGKQHRSDIGGKAIKVNA